MYDRVNVTLPYSVTIGDRTLQPGDYVIQQLRDQGGGSRVLLIYSDNGMKFETSAMTIPALDQNTPEHTRVILHHFGNDYYFDKVWIQGKDYGYEFPVPDSVKARERERMQPLSVAATYSTVQQTESASTTNTTTTAANGQSTTTAANSAATNRQTTTTAATNQGTTSAATNQGTTSAATNQGTTSAATNGQTTTSAATNRATSAAQGYNTQSPATTSGTMTAQNQTTTRPSTVQGQSTTAADNSATTGMNTARSRNDSGADRSMPNTSAGWLMMLLSGGALSGAGLSLRRKR